jgi:hypothetical protein
MRLVKERPDYRLIENNCQNFVAFLLQVVFPNAHIPTTIQIVWDRLRDVSMIASTQDSLLPGAYPSSVTSTERVSFVTASKSSWITTSGDTWVTAVDALSLRNSLSLWDSLQFTDIHSSRNSASQFYDESAVSDQPSFRVLAKAQLYEESLVFRGSQSQPHDSVVSTSINQTLQEPIQRTKQALHVHSLFSDSINWENLQTIDEEIDIFPLTKTSPPVPIQIIKPGPQILQRLLSSEMNIKV